MPRSIDLPAPQLKTPELDSWEIQLRTITPVFGGSATVREVDAENPVRPASVRGHLRFWWRATAGAQYGTPKELFEAEEEVWGSAKKHGKVSLKVVEARTGAKRGHADFVSGFGDPRGYALFPFAPQGNQRAAFCLENVGFTVTANCPEGVKVEVQRAFAAWVMFGGIGARTRRGCGSLEMVSSSNFSPHLPPGLARNGLRTSLRGLYLAGDKTQSPDAAWKRALEVYKFFRQGKDFARDPGSDPSRPNKLGRSRYPEPDTIRRMSPRVRWTHPPKHPVSGFPRADLGLPIVFHFIGEGEDHTLESAYSAGTRFASPVITKAIRVEGGYAPAIILLDAPHVWDAGGLKFERQGKSVGREQVELTAEQRRQVEPLGGLPIREALLEFAKTKGFREVRL